MPQNFQTEFDQFKTIELIHKLTVSYFPEKVHAKDNHAFCHK